MGDLISRKAVIKALRADYKDCISDPGEGQLIAIGLESAVDIVRDIQAEDVTPVVHGRWELVRKMAASAEFQCSCCKKKKTFHIMVLGGWSGYNATPFCCNCGAKMDKEANYGT